MAYLDIVYMRMDYTELLADLAQTENPLYYGEHEDHCDPVGLNLCKMDKKKAEAF